MIPANDGAVEPVTNAAAAGSVFVGRARQGLQEVNVNLFGSRWHRCSVSLCKKERGFPLR